MNLSNQEKLTIIFLILIIITSLGIVIYKNIIGQEKVIINSTYSRINEPSENDSKQIEEPSIIIHISGAVKNPGVYKLTPHHRVIDAIKIAGGEVNDADLDAINLAATLKDGQKINIPYRSSNISEEEEKYLGLKPTNNSGSSSPHQININTSNSALLQTLPGIGPVLAERIIEYRNRNGYFISIEDLKNVSGIGEKKFEGIKDLICVQ